MYDDDDDEGGGGHEGGERWLISYADFITLLFALFVLLYAVSMASEADRGNVWHAVVTAVGSRPLSGGGRPGLGATLKGNQPPAERLGEQGLADARRSIEKSILRYPDSGVSIKADPRGLVISLSAARFFRSGEATINLDQVKVLDAIIGGLSSVGNNIRVEGHTDPRPIKTDRFADNWDLSAARAGNVLRYILNHSKLVPDQFSIAGYGAFHPVAGNDTEDGRALNRRVDIVILRPEAAATEKREGSGAVEHALQ